MYALIRCHTLQHLIWVFTICSGLSVWILWINMVINMVTRQCDQWIMKTPSWCHLKQYRWVVRWYDGVVYLTSPGRPTDMLILAYSWARPAGKGRGNIFISSVSNFTTVPLSSLFLSSISFFPFSGRRHRMTNKG